MSAARRWVLFGLAIASLVVMTYAGVLLAFSVPVTGDVLAANRDLPEADRVIVLPVSDAGTVRTHAALGTAASADLLVAGDLDGTFPAGATNVSMRRALARVEPVNGTYEPASLVLSDVPAANGTVNLTVHVASLAGGASGWIVLGSGEDTPAFYADEDVVGRVERFAKGASLGTTFALGLLGFLAPLVAIVVTHKAPGRRGAPKGADMPCRECGAPFPAAGEFCLRCGAWRGKVEA